MSHLQLGVKLNEVDSQGDLPLDLALSSRQESVAQTLVGHHANTSNRDNAGKTLLHKAIKRGNRHYPDLIDGNWMNDIFKFDAHKNTHKNCNQHIIFIPFLQKFCLAILRNKNQTVSLTLTQSHAVSVVIIRSSEISQMLFDFLFSSNITY